MPDIILGYWLGLISARLDFKVFFWLYAFSLALTFLRQRSLFSLILFALFFMQLVQVNCWLYFGAPLSPDQITGLFKQFDEVYFSGLHAINRLWKGWATLLSSFIFLSFALKNKFRKTFQKTFILILFAMLIYPALLYVKGINKYRVKDDAPTTNHTIRSFSMWGIYAFSEKNISYLPYSKKNNDKGKKNIVLIMGESTSSRYCSLYDYPVKTTPFLDSLKNNKNFAYSKGISCSVTTSTSLAAFFNLMREPFNLSVLKNKSFNLFNLAKEQGYHTACLTSQGKAPFYDAGGAIDTFDVLKDDEDLLKDLSSLSLHEKNFIVLHCRNIHSLYEGFHSDVDDDLSNVDGPLPYLKALRYHDRWIKNTVEILQQLFNDDVVIIFTSDHGELLGEKDLYGHGILHELAADVPIWAISSDESFLTWIKEHNVISHYELCIKIASFLGIDILNPNDDGQTYYIHGTNLLRSSFIKWKYEENKPYFYPPEGYDYESSFTVYLINRKK